MYDVRCTMLGVNHTSNIVHLISYIINIETLFDLAYILSPQTLSESAHI
jgi:hypothetical protein